MFATAAENVRVWSSASLQQCCQFDVVKAPKVSSVSWSPDGKQLASIARNQGIILFTEFGSGQPRHTQLHVEGACMCGQFSHRDSGYFCLGLCDGTVQLLKSGKAVYSYKVHNETTCVAFSNDDAFAASGASDGSVGLFRLQPKGAHLLGGPTGKAVMGLQWSPHGRFQLLSCSADGQLSVWDASALRLKSRHCLHPGQVATALSLSPINDALVATVGLDSTLVLFDMSTASEKASVKTPECLESVAFLPDGQRVVAGASSGRVYLYDLRNTRQTPPTLLGTHMAPTTAIATMQSAQAEAQMAVLVRVSGASIDATASSKSMGPPIRFSLDSANLRPSSSPVDCVNTSKSPDSVFTEEPCDVKGLMDASWTSVESSTRPRKQFRLSDLMPVLADSSLSVARASTLSTCEQNTEAATAALRLSDLMPVLADASLSPPGVLTSSPCEQNTQATTAATYVASETPRMMNGTGAPWNHHSARLESASSSSAPTTPEEACRNQSLCSRCSARAAEPDLPEALVRRLEDTVTERARHMDGHLRHVHVQLCLMQRSFMGEVHSMLQEIFDEVRALRAEIQELGVDI